MKKITIKKQLILSITLVVTGTFSAIHGMHSYQSPFASPFRHTTNRPGQVSPGGFIFSANFRSPNTQQHLVTLSEEQDQGINDQLDERQDRLNHVTFRTEMVTEPVEAPNLLHETRRGAITATIRHGIIMATGPLSTLIEATLNEVIGIIIDQEQLDRTRLLQALNNMSIDLATAFTLGPIASIPFISGPFKAYLKIIILELYRAARQAVVYETPQHLIYRLQGEDFVCTITQNNYSAAIEADAHGSIAGDLGDTLAGTTLDSLPSILF